MSSPSGNLAIETHGLRKVFVDKVAVRGLTLSVDRGEVFGFLGPNGAGKSTSIKMLLGLVAATSGRATVLGRPAGDVKARAKVGFLPEHFRFYEWLSGEELLRVHGRLYGMSGAALRRRAVQLLDLVGLTPHLGKQLRNYSKGMLQRIGLAQALLNEPDLIFLDEPTSGLDPLGRRLIRDIIKAERERGATIFLNSHLLSEVEITCDRVAFIKHGEVLETRRLGEFDSDETTVIVRAANVNGNVRTLLAPWSASVRQDGEQLTLSVSAATAIPEIVRCLVEHGAAVFEVRTQRLSLEERFMQIVGDDGGL